MMQSNQGSTLILKREGLNVITFSNPVEAIDNFERILNYTYNFPSSDSSGDDVINSDAGDDTTYGDNLNGTVAGGNDIINSGEGDDINNGTLETIRYKPVRVMIRRLAVLVLTSSIMVRTRYYNRL
jgi:hypothetical protein